jgi:hypothetical protein
MNEEATKSAADRDRSAIIGDEGVGKALSEKRRFCQTNPSWAADESTPPLHHASHNRLRVRKQVGFRL